MRDAQEAGTVVHADQHLSGGRRSGLVVRRGRPHRARNRPPVYAGCTNSTRSPSPAAPRAWTVPTRGDAKTRSVVNKRSLRDPPHFPTRRFRVCGGRRRTTTRNRCIPASTRPMLLCSKGVNNAVNGCGYSISQDAYDSSVKLCSRRSTASSSGYRCGAICAATPKPKPTGGCSKPGALRSLLLCRL